MKDYHSSHMVEYEKPNSIGYICIEVLLFLKGKKWDEIALAYVHALRPSSIRVTNGEIKTDSRVWRVTVCVNDKDVIDKIEQEVEVGLPAGVSHGHALGDALKYGINSKQCQWHGNAKGYFYDGIETHKLYKTTDEGVEEYPGEGA